MKLEHTDAALKMIPILAKSKKMTDDDFIMRFEDNDELFNIIILAYFDLEFMERFYAGKYIGFCPLCLSSQEPYDIEEIAEVEKVQPSTKKQKIGKIIKKINDKIDGYIKTNER